MVMLLSEWASRLASSALYGRPVAAVLDPTTPRSISAILLPTVMLLAACELLAPYLRAPRPLHFIVGLVLASVAVEVLAPRSHDYGMGWLHDGGVLGFSLLSFSCLAIMGLGIGLQAKRARSERQAFALAGAAGAAGLAAVHAGVLSLATAWFVSTFLLTVALGSTLASWPPVSPVAAWLAVLGRSALLLFILHRLVLQLGERVLRSIETADLRFWILVLATLVLLTFTAVVREGSPRIRSLLQPLGL